MSHLVRRTKAVANGALAWSLSNVVKARVNKYHYGTTVRVLYDETGEGHAGRSIHRGYDGLDYVNYGWSSLISQVVHMDALQIKPDVRAGTASAERPGVLQFIRTRCLR
jgi:hypothetical protein